MKRIVSILCAFLAACAALPSSPSQRRDPNPRLPAGEIVWRGDVTAIERAIAHRDRVRAQLEARDVAPDAAYTWTSLGPENFAGRVNTLLTDPRDENVLWAGTWVGLWKSSNQGISWEPVDFFLGRLIRTLTRDPGNPDVMYAGSGWAYRYAPPSGGGIYKSVDGGASWTALPGGIDARCGVVKISVAPKDSNRILVGTDFGDSSCGGIHLSTDGGSSWTRVLASDYHSGYVHPLASAEFHPGDGARAVGYVGTSLGMAPYYSLDGGVTWTRATGPDADVAMDLAFAPSSPSIVYLVSYDGGVSYGIASIWRSVDGGVSYSEVPRSSGSDFAGQPLLHSLWVSPADPQLIVIGAIFTVRSVDGGATTERVSGPMFAPASNPHQDVSAIVSLPSYDRFGSSRPVFLATDGGVYATKDILTVSPTEGWTGLPKTMQNTMYYDIAVGPTGKILGGMQDTATSMTEPWSVSSQQLDNGDSFTVAADPVDADLYYEGFSRIWRCRYPATCVDVGPPTSMWSVSPMALDPTEGNRMFAASAVVYRSDNIRDSPPSWTLIRPADSPPRYFDAIAVNPVDSNIVWVGNALGNLYKTEDALAAAPTWRHINSTVKGGVTFVGGINRVVIDADEPDRVFICTSRGYLHETEDGGETWFDRSGVAEARLPLGVELWSVAPHPDRRDLLFAATHVGLHVSDDGGGHWYPTGDVPGKVIVRDLLFYRGTSRLVVATHGRGLWYADVKP